MLDRFVSVDVYFFSLVNGTLANGMLDWLMPLLSRMGDYGGVWLMAGLLFWYVNRDRGGGKDFFLLLLSMTLSYMVAFYLKDIFQRPRPFEVIAAARLLTGPEMSFSMPSGHAATSFACALLLTVKWKSRGMVFMVLALLIALSRVYVGVHYPSDIIAGAVVGCLSALMILGLEAGLNRRLTVKRSGFKI